MLLAMTFKKKKEIKMTKRNSIENFKGEVAEWRRELHQNPGIKHEEEFAHNLIKSTLDSLGVKYKTGYGGYGIVATIEGNTNHSGRAIGLRADMDALPLTEESGQEWASKIAGRMHACGHDGHTASLLGVAKYLSETRNFDGQVHLVFQPAEEGGHGADMMIADGLFRDFPMDAIYGLHNWPYQKMGTAAICAGPIMASVDEFNITITGCGGHAAMPSMCIDPIVIASQFITQAQTIISRSTDPVQSAVLSFTDLHAGEGAHNVIPETCTIMGTIRTFDFSVRTDIQNRLNALVKNFAEMNGASAEIEIIPHIDPTINDATEAEFCADIMSDLIGEDNMDRNINPCMGGEDFGSMLRETKGAYIWIGQGTGDATSPHDQGLHSPKYDFNDDALPLIIDYLAELVEVKLKA
jgi:amidohydrolase